jgi:hypothetical protein
MPFLVWLPMIVIAGLWQVGERNREALLRQLEKPPPR